MAVAGSYAYVADSSSGLRIIDVSNPAAPNEVDFYDTLGSANGVAVLGSYAYVADSYGGLDLIWTMLGEVHQLYLPIALRNN